MSNHGLVAMSAKKSLHKSMNYENRVNISEPLQLCLDSHCFIPDSCLGERLKNSIQPHYHLESQQADGIHASAWMICGASLQMGHITHCLFILGSLVVIWEVVLKLSRLQNM